MANRPGEPELLHVEPVVLLDGEPFPAKETYDPKFPPELRTRYVSVDAAPGGDGSALRPWNDLQAALCLLEPGDRLVLAAGVYSGSFHVAGACRNGTAEKPIQVFTRHAFLTSGGPGDVLTVERSHWQFWELQIALLDSSSAGFVTSGSQAHDIAVDQSHIYEGKGPAVRLGAGTSSIVLSNCHIHQSTGIEIESGTRDITLVGNHIHHNRAASVTVGGGASAEPARGIRILGNRIHNDRGAGLDLSSCDGVEVSRNRLSNYRADEGRGGEAIVVRAGSRGVTFTSNSVLEASVGIRVGDSSEGASPAASEIVFLRNFLQNRLTKDGISLSIVRGNEVRFYNNVVDHYAEPFRIAAAGVERVAIANNLVLAPAIAFLLPQVEASAFFDYNVFGAPRGLAAVVGAARVDAASWMASRMPHSQVLPGADLEGSDLGKIVGFSPVDAGVAREGVSYRGSRPDIGVAER